MRQARTSRPRATLLTAALITGVLVVLSTGPAVGADPLCTVTRQLTATPSGSNVSPSISADGDRVAFRSETNSGGLNSDGNIEIFLFDASGPSTTQVTFTTGGFNFLPSVSADGNTVVFLSDRDIVPGQNSDLNAEVFAYDAVSTLTTQISSTTGTNRSPSVSSDGSRIAFLSNDDIDASNPDGNLEVFLYKTAGAATTALTTTTGGGQSNPSISADGTRVAFGSDRDIDGLNPDLNPEVFLYDDAAPMAVLTSTPGGMTDSTRISPDGTSVAFASNRNIGGGNADGNFELFLHDTVGASTTQVTSDTVGLPFLRSISADGTRVAFDSNRNIGGGNTDLNSEVFVYDSTGPSTTQVTSTVGAGAGGPSISADGTRLALTSPLDLTGGNADGNNEIFRAACGSSTATFSDVPASNVFFDQIEWMTAAEVASGFPDGTFRPQDAVKRQQMANFMYNLAGQPAFTPPVTPTFTDYPVGSTFYKQVEWMAAEGVASGFPNGTFRPQDAVKRQQMANFMYNLAGQPAFTPPVTPTFTDYPVGSTFYAQVEWMADENIASGFPDGTFRPQNPVKRQQMANFMYNFAAGVGVGV